MQKWKQHCAGAVGALIVLVAVLAVHRAGKTPRFADGSQRPLAEFMTETSPWLHLEGSSERVSPVYLGATAREVGLGIRRSAAPEIPVALKTLGEGHAETLRQKLGLESVEFEAWPTAHWRGYQTWAFARYRANPSTAWRWIPSHFARRDDFPTPAPELPAHYLPFQRSDDEHTVFRDFLQWPGLYDKPRFSDCVWTDAAGTAIAEAWLPPSQSAEKRNGFLSDRLHAHAIPQPARWNEKPITFVLSVSAQGVQWPANIVWQTPDEEDFSPMTRPRMVNIWPGDFARKFREDVAFLSGARFSRKSAAQKDHQLVEIADYLRERYAQLGIATRRQDFTWRGIPQANVIAVIPGRLGEGNRPIVLADHLDTAFAEDVYEATGERRSTPGADDNATGTATLLRAAEIVKRAAGKGGLAHDVWLVHFTGEEMPADGVGAREFAKSLFTTAKDLGGLIVLDMLGYRQPGETLFQIHPGGSAPSRTMARVAAGAAKDIAPALNAVVRPRNSRESWLYNTDGILFADLGFPVLALNENMNVTRIRHPHYHQSSDTVENVDIPYATAIAKVAIETALRLAAPETGRSVGR